MQENQNLAREVFGTRIAFLALGVLIAAWAPLVPLAKLRLGADEGQLGLMLLGLGIGGVFTMPFTGPLSELLGFKKVLIAFFTTAIIVFPFLSVLDSFMAMAVALMVFGGSVGAADVTINLQAAVIEKRAKRPLMSNFHGMWSVGAFVGAAGMSLLLSLGVIPVLSSITISCAAFIMLIVARTGMMDKSADPRKDPLFVRPKGTVIFLGVLCFLVYLSEHAVLDWSAVLMVTDKGAELGPSGFAYAIFAGCMTAVRFVGDAIRARFGDLKLYVAGASIAALGFTCVSLSGNVFAAYFGFALVGAGVANLVPILFAAASRSTVMPSHLSLTAVATVAHGGLLMGPAIIGFVAVVTSLTFAFILLGAAMVFVAIGARVMSVSS